ncbi:MAG: flagellar hook-length control protein FliK, partial [Bdellovibrionota bacterium]
IAPNRPAAERPMSQEGTSDVESSPATSVDERNAAAANRPSTLESKATTQATPNEAMSPIGKQPKADGNVPAKMPDFFSATALAGGVAATPPVAAQDPAAVAAESTAQMLGVMQDQEIQARQAAMNEFLTQMETELGIPPEKVLQAFSEMDLQALSETPQNSVGAFVEQLDLEPAGQVRAVQLYKGLLDKRGETILSQRLAGLEEGVRIDIASPRDVGLRKLDKSLTDLNAAFFRKDGPIVQNPEKAQQAVESMDAQIAKLMRERGEKTAKRGESEIALMGAAATAGAFATSEMAEGGEAASMIAEDGSSISSMSLSAPDVSMPKLSDFGGDQTSNDWLGGQDQQSKGQAIAKNADASPQNVEFKDSITKEMKTTDKKVTSLRSEQVATEATTTPASATAATGQSVVTKAPIAAGGQMMMGRQPSAGDEQQNIREMVKQAQVMLKRGGGEMKIEMTPEGMGQVHLKVAVENGQVNVQMLTESESAKRLLEKGLGDLKTSLAAQALKVENVRVDVGQEIQKHMDQQAGQEQARNFAREFMQQQREDRQGMRDGAFAMRGIGSYGGNKRAPIEPDSVQSSSTRANSARASGRSLNLVA